MTRVTILPGDCREVLPTLEAASIDACVTDPPYALVSIGKRFGADNAAPAKSNGATGVYGRASAGFMGQKWDTGAVAFDPDTWREVLRVLKPGGHCLAFGGTRTFHRLVCAIEDAGFEIRDTVAWIYGSGFPKSHDVSKAIDRAAGAEREVTRPGSVKRDGYGEDWDTGSSDSRPRYDAPVTEPARQWQGWGTAIKPSMELVCVARKPLIGTVAANVLAHGTGALNIDGCRIETDEKASRAGGRRPSTHEGYQRPNATMYQDKTEWNLAAAGRWPANVILSYPDDEYLLRPDATQEQKADLYRWMSENT